MIIERPKHLFSKTEDAIAKISAILGAIQGMEVNYVSHKHMIEGLYKDWRDFVLKAIEFKMIIPIERVKSSVAMNYLKTGMKPTVVLVADPRAKTSKPKQGDGSCLKPKFNISIYPTDNNKRKEINRLAPLGKSKLPIIGRAEDAGLYEIPPDTSDRIRYLKQLRMAAQARAKNEAEHG